MIAWNMRIPVCQKYAIADPTRNALEGRILARLVNAGVAIMMNALEVKCVYLVNAEVSATT